MAIVSSGIFAVAMVRSESDDHLLPAKHENAVTPVVSQIIQIVINRNHVSYLCSKIRFLVSFGRFCT